MELWSAIVIIVAALGGVILAAYLSYKKSQPGPMVCPLKGDCSSVIHSEFSSFFGIPVEKLGMTYYFLIALSYSVFLAWPALLTPATIFIAVGVSMAAFLFSAYLTFIQLGFLKQICTWCLLSAAISTVIFVTSVIGSDFAFVEFLAQWRPLILIVYLVGLALGVGGTTFSDVFFFKFLRDLKISQEEASILRTVSQVVWFGLGLLVISGAGFFLTSPAAFWESSQLLTVAIVAGVIIVTEAFLNLKVIPHLIHISFGDDPHKSPRGEFRRERRIAFALGAVSLVSWYGTLILGGFSSIPLSLAILLSIYVVLLAVAVAGSQVMERHYGRKPMREASSHPSA